MSNTRGSRSPGIPMPLSRTRITASSCRREALTTTVPFGGVYFAALRTRLVMICSMRMGSASRTSGRSGTETVNACSRASMNEREASSALATAVVMLTGCLRSSTAPRVMRETSSRSSSSRARRRTWRLTVSRALSTIASPASARPMICMAIWIGASGLRSSCESMARNSSLAWFAAARCRTACRCSLALRPSLSRVSISACRSSP